MGKCYTASRVKRVSAFNSGLRGVLLAMLVGVVAGCGSGTCDGERSEWSVYRTSAAHRKERLEHADESLTHGRLEEGFRAAVAGYGFLSAGTTDSSDVVFLRILDATSDSEGGDPEGNASRRLQELLGRVRADEQPLRSALENNIGCSILRACARNRAHDSRDLAEALMHFRAACAVPEAPINEAALLLRMAQGEPTADGRKKLLDEAQAALRRLDAAPSMCGGSSKDWFLGAPITGSRVVFVLDKSSSMAEGDKIGALKDAVVGAIRGLRKDIRFGIAFFDSSTTVLEPPEGVDADGGLILRGEGAAADRVIDACEAWVRSQPAVGVTLGLEAVQAAAGLGADQVLLFTDGDIQQDQAQLDRVLRDLGSRHARVDAFILDDAVPDAATAVAKHRDGVPGKLVGPTSGRMYVLRSSARAAVAGADGFGVLGETLRTRAVRLGRWDAAVERHWASVSALLALMRSDGTGPVGPGAAALAGTVLKPLSPEPVRDVPLGPSGLDFDWQGVQLDAAIQNAFGAQGADERFGRAGDLLAAEAVQSATEDPAEAADLRELACRAYLLAALCSPQRGAESLAHWLSVADAQGVVEKGLFGSVSGPWSARLLAVSRGWPASSRAGFGLDVAHDCDRALLAELAVVRRVCDPAADDPELAIRAERHRLPAIDSDVLLRAVAPPPMAEPMPTP